MEREDSNEDNYFYFDNQVNSKNETTSDMQNKSESVEEEGDSHEKDSTNDVDSDKHRTPDKKSDKNRLHDVYRTGLEEDQEDGTGSDLNDKATRNVANRKRRKKILSPSTKFVKTKNDEENDVDSDKKRTHESNKNRNDEEESNKERTNSTKWKLGVEREDSNEDNYFDFDHQVNSNNETTIVEEEGDSIEDEERTINENASKQKIRPDSDENYKIADPVRLIVTL